MSKAFTRSTVAALALSATAATVQDATPAAQDKAVPVIGTADKPAPTALVVCWNF